MSPLRSPLVVPLISTARVRSVPSLFAVGRALRVACAVKVACGVGVAFTLAATESLLAQSAAQQAQVDSIFAEFGAETPGAAVAVVRDGRVVLRAGYGMANLDHDIPVGPETVFDIASVSKQFGGMAVAMLVESGAIDLDAEVRTYLPELPDFGHSLTVRHLVHHTSGIRDWPLTLSLAGWRYDDVISFDQILRMAWNQQELNFPPGEEYSYSNTGYNLLAEIVQRVSGDSFRTWTDEHMFGPLGMTSTHFQDDHREIVPRRAQGYSRGGDAWVAVPNGLTALGSSSLHSSVDDLAKWLVNYDSHAVGGTAVIDRMRTQGVLGSGETIAYAYGISRGSHRGRETWSHSGSWAGNRTFLLHFPELRAGVVVLSNSGVYSPAGPAHAVADVLFGDALGPAPEPEASRPAPDRPEPVELSERELREYTGTWVSEELDTSYVLSMEAGRLVANHYRHGRIPMASVEKDLFGSNRAFFQSVRFERNGDGSLGDMFVGQGRARNLRFARR